MNASAGVFEAFYGSFAQHPVLLWIAAIVATLFCFTLPLERSTRRYCAALCLVSLLDAWLTSTHVVGLGTLTAPYASVVPLTFVLIGDFRFLFLIFAATREGGIAPSARAFFSGAALCALVPLASQGVVSLVASSTPRLLFLIYETLFVTLVAALLRFHPRLRAIPWLRRVSFFVLTYYSLWALADLLLLSTGIDLAFALRVVPNTLYYGGFIAAVGLFASRVSAVLK